MKISTGGHVLGVVLAAIVSLQAGCSPSGKGTPAAATPVFSEDGTTSLRVEEVLYGKKGEIREEDEYGKKLALQLTSNRKRDSDVLVVVLDIPADDDIEIALEKDGKPGCLLAEQGGQSMPLLAWTLEGVSLDAVEARLVPAGAMNLYVLAHMREGKHGLFVFPLPAATGLFQVQGVKGFASVPVVVE